MSDEFLNRLHAQWRQQDATFAEIHIRLRRARWRPHLVLGFELVACVGGFVVGLWFAWTAVALSSLLFALSAAVMLLAVPAFAVAAIVARKGSLRWEDETPQSVLRVGLRRADASLRAIRVGRWHMVVAVAFVAVLWLLEWTGLIQARRFLLFYTALMATALGAQVAWMRWRERQVRAQRAVCKRLLDDLETNDADGPAPI